MKLNEIKIWKFNVLDITLALIIIIFIGVFASTKLNISDENAVATGNNNVVTQFTYTILVEGLSVTSKDMLKEGDQVYDKVSGTYIGKIAKLEINDAKGLLERKNGEIILANIPGKIDVKITVETEGAIKNGEYLANGLIRIMVGNLKEIKTKYLMCFGTISAIDRDIKE